MGDGDDPAAGDEPDGGLDPHERARRGRADNGPVGLGADADRGEVGGDRGPRAGARAAGTAVEGVGVPALAAPGAPAARRAARAEVRPLGQVRLPDDHGARLAQLPHDERVLGRPRSHEGERARGRGHAVRGRDVVLDQHGNPVQRPAWPLRFALGVEPSCDEQGFGVRLDDGAQGGPAPIELVDAGEVVLAQRPRGVLAVLHPFLQIGDGRLGERERWDDRSRNPGRGPRRTRPPCPTAPGGQHRQAAGSAIDHELTAT